MAVLILSIIALSVSVTLLATGITASQNSLTKTSRAKAQAFANACIEKAMDEIRTDNLYTGTVNLSFTDGDCSAIVTDIPGTNKRIESTGTSDLTTQRQELETSQIYPQLIIDFRRNLDDY
ncbi:hypothetical protein GF389_04810 [Candidatus Dojkabacteria bacterium]|nr:hypothetical protein [Candidatus Dojkabacteria bacterium]